MQIQTKPTRKIILDVRGLKKYFPIHTKGIVSRVTGYIKAVDGVNFDIHEGETFGLVGESGCGKTTIGKTILRLEKPTDGQVLYCGIDLFALNEKKMRLLRREMQMIFQDPYSSLDPRMAIGDIIAEPMRIHRTHTKEDVTKRVAYLLNVVGLPSYCIKRLPQELSGGQRQRIGIARALALNPKLIVCDEPVSALDVSIQSQVLNLLSKLQKEMGLSYLFIAHGMAVVKHISDRVGVMYLGRMMEISTKNELYENPMHPYTKALLSAIPIPNPRIERNCIILEGDIPSPINPPSGCLFHTRCEYAKEFGERCVQVAPTLLDMGNGHHVACHLYENKV